MANNYLEFSETIEHLTVEEIDWWSEDATDIGSNCDDTVCHDYEIDTNRRSVWFHAEECGNVDAVSLVVHEFLKKFRTDDYFELEWACWCSKPRIGEFYGGGIFVTAKEIRYHCVSDWLGQMRLQHGGGDKM